MERVIWVKTLVFSYYRRGKDLEIRINDPYYRQVKVGDHFLINRHLRLKVLAIRKYSGFTELLLNEKVERILPGYGQDAVLTMLRSVYKPEAEKNGVLVFELQHHEA